MEKTIMENAFMKNQKTGSAGKLNLGEEQSKLYTHPFAGLTSLRISDEPSLQLLDSNFIIARLEESMKLREMPVCARLGKTLKQNI